MSALVLHAVLDGLVEPDKEAPLHRHVAFGDLQALVSAAILPETEDEDTAIAAALAHHRLLTCYCRAADILPIRFGTAFSSERALCGGLVAAETEMRDGLARIRGCVEYVLTVTPGQAPAQSEPVTAGGRAFLAAKRRRRDDRLSRGTARSTFVADLRAKLSDLARAVAPLGRGAEGNALLRHALLVRRDDALGLAALLQQHEERATALGLDLRLSGPGPCYSFANPTANTESEASI